MEGWEAGAWMGPTLVVLCIGLLFDEQVGIMVWMIWRPHPLTDTPTPTPTEAECLGQRQGDLGFPLAALLEHL